MSSIDKAYDVTPLNGLKLIIKHEKHAPVITGSVHVVESASANIRAHVKITSSIDSSLTQHIQVVQAGPEIRIEIGGISFWQSIGARATVTVSVAVPRGTSGALSITTDTLPISMQSLHSAGDVILRSDSSTITVGTMEANSLCATTQSGSILFEESSEQRMKQFIKVASQSGSLRIGSILLSPLVEIANRSGGTRVQGASDAESFTMTARSGGVQAELEFMGQTCTLALTNVSGSIQFKSKHWSGFLTAVSGSGSVTVKGDGVVQKDGGWSRGNGASKAKLECKSGLISANLY